MSEHRQKTHSILLRTEGKIVSLELFDSREWPEENGSESPGGLFRVRIDDAWHCPTGKYSFLTLSAVGELVSALLAGGEVSPEEPAPYLPVKADVRVYLEDADSREMGSVRTEPYQRRDGRWYVQVWVFGRGVMEFCCNDVTLRRVRR